MYSSYLLESWKSKHQIDKVEEVTSTKRRKDLTNASFEDDSRNNTAVVAYSGKSMDDRSILESADSKMNQVNNNSHSSSSVPSSNFNREEDIDPEYYDVKKRAKILYSWEGAINKIDFKVNSKKDEYFYETFGITGVRPVFVDHSGFVVLMLDSRGIMFKWNEMEHSMKYMRRNLKEGLANPLKYGCFKRFNQEIWKQIGMISFGIWVCGAQIRIYEIDLNYDGIYRMILIANIITPTEHAQFLNLHRISEVLTIITSNTTPNSPSRSTYSRETTPSPKPVRITISGLQPN
ncbi:24420_t:CDS:2 [Gigaspora rosea]|nr:24420_t:CDS:2 [Gigaspora rosea]